MAYRTVPQRSHQIYIEQLSVSLYAEHVRVGQPVRQIVDLVLVSGAFGVTVYRHGQVDACVVVGFAGYQRGAKHAQHKSAEQTFFIQHYHQRRQRRTHRKEHHANLQ